MSPAGPVGGGNPSTPTAQGTTSRDSIGSIMHEFVDSFPIDMDSRQSISDLGKVLFTEGQKSQDGAAAAGGKKPYQMPKEIKGIPRQKQQDVMGITASGRVALPQGSVRKLMQTQGKAIPMRWTPEEDDMLRQAVETHGERNWKSIAEIVPGRNHTQCLQRWTKVLAPGLIKGHWRPDEDDVLRQLVAEGRKNWGQVAARIPGRTSKQCRERWYNHLDPNIIRGDYTQEEDQVIIEAQQRIGNRWSAIAAMLPGRTEDAVKIRWKSLCRTKSGRNRKAQAEKEEKQAYDASVNGASPAYRMNHGMGYDHNQMLPPFQQGHHHQPMHHHHHQSHMSDYPPPPSDMYYHQPHHQGGTPGGYMPSPAAAFNPASAFMQKMTHAGGGGGFHPPGTPQHMSDYNQQPYYGGGGTPGGYARPGGGGGYPTGNYTSDSYEPMKVEPTYQPAREFGSAATASSGSPRHSLVSSFVQSLNGGNSPPRHSLAANFAQTLGSGTGPPTLSRPPPMNLAASFAQTQQTPKGAPAPLSINIAASFAQRTNHDQAPADDNADPNNKRPRLPVNMDAARAAAARRMRQGDNHGDFVATPGEAPSGEMPRISVSDINLSELGPIEEMWRVSSDMNRLSL
ncbi:Aste57867_9586 [Aphanomyces stellatus]|uniref:Aste57867_9586 protein n=1 Tax=Aphanomyces stellatus TaxID=120398 RepID=A0A485KNR8_9STRA|nr:hypothetical protein As57867_009548 [Aphanomyces stellatus]VFT86465.1 Aste57867_9586 [Aphanomyces stellatus]